MNEAEVRTKYQRITRLLIDKGLEITTMESCTGGLLASFITDTEGSSAAIKGAYVTYSNAQKVRLGVPAETIEKYSVYSEETARAMAAACRSAFKADIGVGVTGTAGNVDPANPEASVPGCVFFAIDFRESQQSFSISLPSFSDRYMYKLAAADAISEELLKLITDAEL